MLTIYLEIPGMYICRALLKHDYYNFKLEILEYCEPSKCLEREGFYQKKKTKLNPEYNISLNSSAPMSGRKHSDESKQIIYEARKGKTHSDETKQKISEAHIGLKKYQPRASGAEIPSQQIEVTDIQNNTTISYDSISEAAKALNINISIISEYFSNNQQKPYKGQYTFKKKNQLIID